MKTDEGTLSFATAVDLKGLEGGISLIDARISAMESRLQSKIDNIGTAVSKANNNIEDSLKGVTEAGGDVNNILGVIAKTAGSIGVAFTAQSLISEIVNVRGEFQKLEVSFKTMLGSEEKATDLMNQLVRTAATTPFDLQGVADGARQLLAYGENVENVNDDLIRLGNIAAGLNQPLSDLVYLYGTTMTQGRLYTQDYNQFVGRGIPLGRELASVLGVTESKVREMVEAGKVGFPEVQKALQNLTNEGGMFYNLMEEQSKTISGQISNIEDSISTMFNTLGKQSEGVINTALGGVSSLVENYEQTGRVLLSLVEIYGVYKVACMTITALQALQTAGVGALTTAETIHYGWLVLVEKAQKLLNATMLSNPYILVATLIATVVAAMISMRTESERMRDAEEEYQNSKQKTIEAEEEHRRKLEELCSVAGDESLATDTRREALNKLEQKYPDIFAKYDTEYEKLKNIKRIKEEIAELEGKSSITRTENELKLVDARIKELEAKKATARWEDANGSGTRMRKVGGLTKGEEAELKNLQNKRNSLSTQARKEDVNAYFENLTGISNETLQKQIDQRRNLLAKMQTEEKKYGKITQGNALLTGTYSRDELQYQLNKLQSEKNKRNAKRGSSADWASSAKAEYEKALKAYNDFINSTSNNLTKEEFEKKAKELDDAVKLAKKEYDSAKPGSNKDADKEKKQREKEEREEAQRIEKQRKLGQDLVQVQEEAKNAEIASMEDGIAKKLALIDLEYTQKKNKLDKQESDWKKENKDAGMTVGDNGLTSEQTSALQEARKQLDAANKKATQDALKEEADMQEEALNNYYIKYGTMQEKILALNEEYSRKIRDAKAKGDEMSLQKELSEAVANVKMENLKKSINWDDVFGNISEQSTSSLSFTLDKIKSVDTSGMNISDIKDIQEAISKIENEIASRNPFTALYKSINDISARRDEFVTAMNEYAESIRSINEAQAEYDAALENERLIREQIDNGSISEDSEEYKSAVEATALAQDKLNKAQEKGVKTEQNAVRAKNSLTSSYKSFATNLKSVNTVIKDIGGDAANLASVFSDSVANGIEKSIGFLSDMLDATSTVINAIGDTGKSVASAMQTTAQATGTAVQGTATATTAAISTVEKASVILAVISAALQIATAIANLFNNDDEKQEEIERLQERIDQLQWELDNAEVVRLQNNTGSELERLKNTLSETREEVLKLHLTTNQYYSAWSRALGTVIYQNEIYEKSVEKLADAYAGMAYTADKALGRDKYDEARGQLKNLAEQQILLQQQINEENDKKDSDSGQIAEWERKIQEIGQEMTSIINEMMEDIIGYTSTDLASELGNAFFDAFKNGEDAAQAWGDKVNDIVGDILRKMMIQSLLEQPIGQIFDKYKKKWFGSDGTFQGFDAVNNSLTGLAEELNALVGPFSESINNMPDELKELLLGDVERQGTEKGIATASQESVDENNARLTTIQGHTYSINQGVIELNRTGNAMLEKLTGIEENTATTNDKLDELGNNIKKINSSVDDMNTKGIKVRT